MNFKRGDRVSIKGIHGAHTVDCKVNRFCESLGRSYYKFLLSNGSEYWGDEITAYKPRRAPVWRPRLAPIMRWAR